MRHVTVMFLPAALLLAALANPARAQLFSQCPAVGADSGCGVLLTVGAGGCSIVTSDPNQPPFDSIEDTLTGIQNNSGSPLCSIVLSSTTDIFGFDGDGICDQSPAPAGCPFGVTGYEGPGVSFSYSGAFLGTVKFTPCVAPGDSAYFGLEEALTVVGVCNGNATCEASCGETCVNCPSDCGQCTCGNGVCDPGESPGNCPDDCVPPCGNGSCELGETCTNCPSDCGLCFCGNGTCEAPEDCDNCAADCGPCMSSTTTNTTATSTTSTVTTTTVTTTTATTAPSTTTTTLPCSGPPAATYQSIDCRFDTLIAFLGASAELGSAKSLLVRTASHAQSRKIRSETSHGVGNDRRAQGYLRQAIRLMISFNYRVVSLASRQQIPTGTEAIVMPMGQSIQQDMQTLLRTL